MRIDSIDTNKNISRPNFKAVLKNNGIVNELYVTANADEKKEFNRILKAFSYVADGDVIELRKEKKNNIEDYSLVNAKDERKKVLVCKLFPNVICDGDRTEDYQRKHTNLAYIRESLMETIKETSHDLSNAYHQLFK